MWSSRHIDDVRSRIVLPFGSDWRASQHPASVGVDDERDMDEPR